jgi:Ser-tRNA(Ala) deacylase AlaX
MTAASETYSETYLECLNDSYKFEAEAQVVSVTMCEDGRTAVVLNKTIFYPQGGGQPADQGSIESGKTKFEVGDVRLINGLVFHYGNFLHGHFFAGDPVKLSVAKERRMLNARLHSAGHLIDVVIQKLGLNLQPSKAYHFPDGPYVEYSGSLESANKEDLAQQIESEAKQLIDKNMAMKVTVTDSENATVLCGKLPDYVDQSKPIRVVSLGDNTGCPCAGTHLKELADLGSLTISRIRTKGDKTRISYVLK